MPSAPPRCSDFDEVQPRRSSWLCTLQGFPYALQRCRIWQLFLAFQKTFLISLFLKQLFRGAEHVIVDRNYTGLLITVPQVSTAGQIVLVHPSVDAVVVTMQQKDESLLASYGLEGKLVLLARRKAGQTEGTRPDHQSITLVATTFSKPHLRYRRLGRSFPIWRILPSSIEWRQ